MEEFKDLNVCEKFKLAETCWENYNIVLMIKLWKAAGEDWKERFNYYKALDLDFLGLALQCGLKMETIRIINTIVRVSQGKHLEKERLIA